MGGGHPPMLPSAPLHQLPPSSTPARGSSGAGGAGAVHGAKPGAVGQRASCRGAGAGSSPPRMGAAPVAKSSGRGEEAEGRGCQGDARQTQAPPLPPRWVPASCPPPHASTPPAVPRDWLQGFGAKEPWPLETPSPGKGNGSSRGTSSLHPAPQAASGARLLLAEPNPPPQSPSQSHRACPQPYGACRQPYGAHP